MLQLTLDEKRDLCSIPVTLNGRPAAICGARNEFARIIMLSGGLSAQFDWETVRNIATTTKAFVCDDPYGKRHLQTKAKWTKYK